VALAVGFLFLGWGRPLICRESQDGWRFHTGQLPPAESVGQTFKSRLPDLSRLDVKLVTFGRPLVKPLTLHLVQVQEARPEALARPMPAVDAGVWLAIHDGLQIGQTFVPHRDDLSGLWLFIDASRLPPQAEVRLRVWRKSWAGLPGDLVAESKIRADKLPASGFFKFGFKPLKEVRGRSLLFTVDVKGAPFGQDLRLRFVSDQGQPDGRPWMRSYPEGETWRPEITYGQSRKRLADKDEPYADRAFAWDYWKGDLVFSPAYPRVLPSGPEIRRVTKPGWLISDGRFNSFSFKPLADSQGQNYYFYLTAGPGPGKAPAALADWGHRYPSGALVLDGVPTRGGLAFRAYNALDRGLAGVTLLRRVTLNKPGPWGLKSVVVGLAGAHLLLLGLLLGAIWSRGRQG